MIQFKNFFSYCFSVNLNKNIQSWNNFMCYYDTIDLKVTFIGFHLIFSCSYCAKWIMLEIIILVMVEFFPYGFKSWFQIWVFPVVLNSFSSIVIYRLTEMLWYLITLPLWVQITHFTKQNVSYQWVRGIHWSYHMFHYPVTTVFTEQWSGLLKAQWSHQPRDSFLCG